MERSIQPDRPDAVSHDRDPVAQAQVEAAAAAGQRLAIHWGHPSWSDSWAEQVAETVLNAACQIQQWIDDETVICCDCGGIGKPSCDRDGHGLVTLGDLIDCYSNPASRPDAVSEEQLEAACAAFGSLEGTRLDTGSVVPPALSERIRAAIQAARQEDPLVGEVAGLREALKPFAGCFITEDGKPPPMDYDWPPMGERITDWFCWDDFQKARAALEGGETGG